MRTLINTIASLAIILFTTTSCTKPNDPVQTVRIVLPSGAGYIAQHASEILAREIAERSGAKILTSGKAGFTVEMAVEPGVGAEGFTITDNGNGKVKITGNDENGLLYGVGKFLHTSRYDQGGFTPGTWRGTDVPKGTMRGIYFATHFNNWYEAATDEERQQYIESLALWGTNALVVHYPDQWLSGIDDPKAQAWIRKMKRLMIDARSVGIKVGLLQCVNAGYTSSPKELYATKSDRCWGLMLCPSKPEARKLLLKNWETLISGFTNPGLDLVVYWPYDEGGCACKQCSPWGGNGYLKLCKDYSGIVREKFPDAKIIISAWFFDRDPNDNVNILLLKDGEYARLDQFISSNPGLFDYVMTDAHRDFPEYPLKVRVPGDLPMVNFPEISMWGQYPWGGYGANPLPQRFQRLWNEVKGKVAGGFPYSEGIFEDMNKVIYSQFYWNPDCLAENTVKEYIAYEYSPDVVDSVMKATGILEQNHNRRKIGPAAEEAFKLIKEAESKLTPRARQSWRWRMLFARTQIDCELYRTGGIMKGRALKDALDEVEKISHAENARDLVHPPVIKDPEAKGDSVPQIWW